MIPKKKEKEQQAQEEEERHQKKEEKRRSPKNHSREERKAATECGWMWEYCKDTNEYRAVRLDKKGSAQLKGAPAKGAEDWNLVTENYKNTGRWESPTEVRRKETSRKSSSRSEKIGSEKEVGEATGSKKKKKRGRPTHGASSRIGTPMTIGARTTGMQTAATTTTPQHQAKGKWKYGGGGKKGW